MTVFKIKSRGLKNKGFVRSTLLASMLLATTSAFMASPAIAGDTLTVAQREDPQNLDPIDTFRLSWGAIGSNIFDGLLVRNESLELGPALATKWEFLDEDKRIRFTLREGVTFHNGEAFDANAVKYTFDRLLGKQGEKGPQRSNYTSIKSVEIVDNLTVDFIMARPDPVLITKLAGYGAMIVPPKYIEEVGEKAFDLKPVGTGPFKVISYEPSVGVKLEKFDAYWNGTAKTKNVFIRFIPEPATRMAELLSGGIDIALNVPTTSVETIRKNPNVDLVSVDGPSVQLVRFKTHDAITADKRVREAINLAIDKQAIVDVILQGLGSTITSAQGKKSLGYLDLEAYPYDPARAKALLAEAGIKPGTEIALDMRSSDGTFREVAQVIGSYLNMVGLKMKIRTHENNVYSSEILAKGRTGEMFSFLWGGWTFDFDNTAYLLYHSGERYNPYINDHKLNALLEGQRQTYDVDVRRKALQKVAAYAHENVLDMPLYNTATLYGVSQKVKDFSPAPDDRTRYMNVIVD